MSKIKVHGIRDEYAYHLSVQYVKDLVTQHIHNHANATKPSRAKSFTISEVQYVDYHDHPVECQDQAQYVNFKVEYFTTVREGETATESSKKDHILFKRTGLYLLEYLKSNNPYNEFTNDKQQAMYLTYQQARNICNKLNRDNTFKTVVYGYERII